MFWQDGEMYEKFEDVPENLHTQIRWENIFLFPRRGAFSVTNPDPGSGLFFIPESGMSFFRISDRKPIFLRAWEQIFWLKLFKLCAN